MYRVGIIGCGWVSVGHCNGYLHEPRTKIVAAADLMEDRRCCVGREWDIERLYKDYLEMLASEQLDIVSICTWPGLHRQMVIDAVKHGAKAVLCEKPFALSVSDADEMISVCEAAGCLLIVNHQRRFERRYVEARGLIRDGVIGEVVSLAGSGSDFFEDGSHIVDLIMYLNGDVPARSVMGVVDWDEERPPLYGHRGDRASVAYITFENDASGIVTMRALRTKHQTSYGFSVLGTEGAIQISGGNPPEVRSWIKVQHGRAAGGELRDASDELLGTPRSIDLGKDTIAYFWLSPWQLQVTAMVDSLETGEQHICEAGFARAGLEVLAGICQSSEQQRLIKAPADVVRTADYSVPAGGGS